MGHYNGNAAAVHDLVRETEVHRDVYIDQEIFDLEMEHLFANTWIYVGHDSQVPNAGDYYGTTIGKQPVLMVRHTDGVVHVLYNRCPHKGTRITIDTCGNAGKFFRCPYHAWSFKTDGSLLAIPLRKGYEHTGLEQSEAIQGHSARPACEELSRLRVRQDERRRAGLRGLFRRKPLDHRQHGRSLAGRPAGSGRRRAPLHAQLQLENAGREPDRHLPSDGRPRSVGRNGGRGVEEDVPGQQQEAAGRRDLFAVHLAVRVLRKNGNSRLAQRPRPYRRAPFDPFRLFGDPRLFRQDGRRLRRRARQGDPRREPAQHVVLSRISP